MKNLVSVAEAEVENKTALVRVDLNVPMHRGHVTDRTRIERILPTIKLLISKGAKVVLLSHIGRPKGNYEPSMSLAPLVDELQTILGDIPVRFSSACFGLAAHEAVEQCPFRSVLLLENLRFHSQEETGDDSFAQNLANLGDIYVNEAFSCSHRAHASITGVPRYLPSFAGLSLLEEVCILQEVALSPMRPVGAVIGGSKVSTKIELLINLVQKVDYLFIGGAMANTLLHNKGYPMGRSVFESGMESLVDRIFNYAKTSGCEILLPKDFILSYDFQAQSPCKVQSDLNAPHEMIAVDIGPETVRYYSDKLENCHMLIWNGPLGAFELSPFDASTVQLARKAAGLTAQNKLKTIAGGGDTLAALRHSGLAEEFSYLSTAGGAFLEWLEGKSLPGISVLQK